MNIIDWIISEYREYVAWARMVRRNRRDIRRKRRAISLANDMALIYNKVHYVFRDVAGRYHVWTSKQLKVLAKQQGIHGKKGKSNCLHVYERALYIANPRDLRMK